MAIGHLRFKSSESINKILKKVFVLSFMRILKSRVLQCTQEVTSDLGKKVL